MSSPRIGTVTIADTASLSDAFYLGDECLTGIITPSGWTTAALSVQVSLNNTDFFVLWDQTGEFSVPAVVASRAVAIDPYLTKAWKYVKVQSGTSGAAVAQAGGDVLTLVTNRVS